MWGGVGWGGVGGWGVGGHGGMKKTALPCRVAPWFMWTRPLN